MGSMNKILGIAGSKAILAIIAVVLMSQYPHLISLQFTSLEQMDDKFIVTGRVHLRRTDNYLEWLGPEHLTSFNAWWSSPQAKTFVARYTHRMIQLQRISWNIVKEKQNSDILEFKAVFSLGPNFPADPGTTPKTLMEIVRTLP